MSAFIAAAALSIAAAGVQLAPAAPETCLPWPAATSSEAGAIARRAVPVQLGAVAAEATHTVRIGIEAADRPPDFAAGRRVRVGALEGRRARLVVEHQVSIGGEEFGWNERLGLTREIDLADGRVEEVGGIPFLIAASGGGWTIAPQADLFPAFVRLRCRGAIDVG